MSKSTKLLGDYCEQLILHYLRDVEGHLDAALNKNPWDMTCDITYTDTKGIIITVEVKGQFPKSYGKDRRGQKVEIFSITNEDEYGNVNANQIKKAKECDRLIFVQVPYSDLSSIRLWQRQDSTTFTLTKNEKQGSKRYDVPIKELELLISFEDINEWQNLRTLCTANGMGNQMFDTYRPWHINEENF